MSRKTSQEMLTELVDRRWQYQQIKDRLLANGFRISTSKLCTVKHGTSEASEALQEALIPVHKEMMKL